ncbi:uncharacterized protein LOC130216573 [Danio aesculapii]|uniref:uncharacterized protein LOC130216573 n=1 Tax=Danio aesculapii TaxID=1142201 RepID=UPI0024C0CC95|nr:uncharacterized protein LOC130216573 [Danio aesculapii]
MKIFTFLTASLLMHSVSGDDEVKSLFVTEGDSVTLYANVTDIQTDDLLIWTFGLDNTVIVNNFEVKKYRDRLLVNQKTGSLVINNITVNFSGIYKLENIRKSTYRLFRVTVYAHLPVPVIIFNSLQCPSSSGSSDSKCVLLCSVVNVSAASLSWYKGNSVLSSISVSDLSINASLHLEVEYQDRNTYSCVINNPISNQSTHLDIDTLCQTCKAQGPSTSMIVGICVGLLLAAVAVAVAGYYYLKKSPKTNQNREHPLNEAGQLPLLPPAANNEEAGPGMLPSTNHEPITTERAVPAPVDQVDNQITGVTPGGNSHQNNDAEITVPHRYLPNDIFHDEPDLLRNIRVKSGESITLKTGVTEIKRDDVVKWKYGDSRVSDCTTLFKVIAVVYEGSSRCKEGPDGRFKDKLELDRKTGNLKIKNVRVKHSGHYKLKIESNTHPLSKTIKVTVRAGTASVLDDPNDLSLIPEEEPQNTTTYSVEPANTTLPSNEDTDEELS